MNPAEQPVTVTVRALRGGRWSAWPAEVRLRLALKVLLRRYGLRVEWADPQNRTK